MICWLIAALLTVSPVLTEEAFAIKRIAREVNRRVYGFDRFIDMGVRLRVVRRDPNGEITLPSGLRVTQVDEKRWGGIVDTKASTPYIKGASKNPREWLCSEDQFPIIMHSDDLPMGQLVIGSEGSGKTTALCMWHHRMWTLNLGEFREGGQTAPTLGRLGNVKIEMLKVFSPTWARYVARDEFEGFDLCDGSRIRYRYTHQQSAAKGAPIQGYNWSWCGRDEMQDQVEAHADIESRGRAARGGGTYYKQLGTATAKDDPSWRTLRDALIAGGKWKASKLLVASSPFVSPTFLADKRASGVSDREYRRRWLAEDVPPESRLYFNWDRDQNLRPIPRIGARDVTSTVIGRKVGPGFVLLLGHDPGTSKAASVFLQAYELRDTPDPVWWVRGELFTMHQTAQQHALQARQICSERFGQNVHVRAQPMGIGDDKPDLDTYKIWRDAGFDIRAAQVRKDGTGTGKINRESRVSVVNSLFRDANGKRRLFIDCDDLRRPCAPKLVEALEVLERDERGRIDSDKRLDYDKSDLTDALGYALWPWEKALASALRNDIRNHLERDNG